VDWQHLESPHNWRKIFALKWSALGRNLSIGLDQVEAEFAQVRDATNRLRLLPAATVFSSLERAVRDAAQSLHKEVMFESFGGANRLDAHVLAALRDALLHVVRNAVWLTALSIRRNVWLPRNQLRDVSNCAWSSVVRVSHSSATTMGAALMWRQFARSPFAKAWWRPRT